MKMNTFNKYLLVVCFTIAAITTGRAQSRLSPSDSTIFAAAASDTTKLRQLIVTRRGETIAAKAQNRIAKLANKAKNQNVAEREFRQTYNQYFNTPEGLEAAYYLGKISHRNGKPEEAKKYLKEFLISNPKKKDAQWAQYYLLKSMCRTDDSGFSSAVHAYFSKRHEHTESNDPSLQYDLIRHLMNRHQYQEALNESKLFVSRFPLHELTTNVQFQIGDLYVMMDKPKDAIQQYSLLIKTASPNSETIVRAHYQLGALYDGQNDSKKARIEYELVKRQFPLSTRWVNASEYSLVMIGYRAEMDNQPPSDSIGAYAHLKEFITAHPSDHHVPRAWMALADLCIKAGQYSEAVAVYEQIIHFDRALIPLKPKAAVRSNDVKAHRELVLQARLAKANTLRSQMQKPAEALSEYEEILIAQSSNGDAKLKKAMCLMDIGKMEQASGLLNALVAEGGVEKDAATHLLNLLKKGN